MNKQGEHLKVAVMQHMAANCCRNHRRRLGGEHHLLPKSLEDGPVRALQNQMCTVWQFLQYSHTALSISKPWPYVVEDAAL
ncbi:hypothetical protein SRHO_G00072310 [Serrasalmus rhombeus]